MKTKDFKDLKTKEVKELRKNANDLVLQLSKIKAKIASGQEKNLKGAKNLRRDIARILTLIKEKEIVEKLKTESEEVKVKKEEKGETI